MKTPKQYKQMEYVNVMKSIIELALEKRYLELGVKKAHTFNSILPYADYSVGVDIIDSEPYIKGFLPEEYEFYQMTTSEFATKYDGPKFDFIFIDADHKKESVLNDVAMMERHIKPYSGLLFLHDTFPASKELCSSGYCFNAWEAAKFIHNKLTDWEIVTIPFPWAGLSILRYCLNGFHGIEFYFEE